MEVLSCRKKVFGSGQASGLWAVETMTCEDT